MSSPPEQPTIAAARRMGAEAMRDAGRSVAERAVRRGGARVARLDRLPAAHAALLHVVEKTIPRLFDPAAADDLDETFELRIRNPRRPEPDRFSLTIARRCCVVSPGPAPSARAGVTVGADDLVRLVSGEVGWPELLSSGRLELTGDPFLGLRFPRLFALPSEPGRPAILDARRSAIKS
jgi:hypothetical protein